MTRPLDVLESAKDRTVLVALKNKLNISGILRAFDLHLNVHIDDAKTVMEKDGQETEVKLGSMLIRGDCIVYISPAGDA